MQHRLLGGGALQVEHGRGASVHVCLIRRSATPQGAMLLLVTAGAGEARSTGGAAEAGANPDPKLLEAAPAARMGDVFFVPAGTSLQLAAAPSAPLTLWVAAVNAQVFDDRFRLPAAARPGVAAPAAV